MDAVLCGTGVRHEEENDMLLLFDVGNTHVTIGGYDTNGPAASVDATHDIIEKEVKRCLDTYGKYHKGYCFFGFRYVNSLDPAVIASVMMPIGQGATEYAFELLAQGK